MNISAKAYYKFRDFEDKFDKNYQSGERVLRAQIFEQNLKRMTAHNGVKKNTWKMGINEFADWSDEEFEKSRLMKADQDCSATSTKYIKNFSKVDLPEMWDWRIRGGVSPVKNQGHCGSCWTFSTTGCMESAWAIHHNRHFNLSEQQLVDCAGNFDNHGCSGGLPSHAFEYIHYSGGLEEEGDYEYTAKDGDACLYDEFKAKATVKEVFNITETDEDQLTLALAFFNPVSIAFQVVSDFRFYKEGVYKSDDCKNGAQDVNHAVLAVGYGTCDECGTPFYIVKNSWGASWGDGGFFKIERGTNMCGVARCASFPIV